MQDPPSERDLEKGNPESKVKTEKEEEQELLLSAGFSGYQFSKTRNPEEFRIEPLGANEPSTSLVAGTEPILIKFETEKDNHKDEVKMGVLGAGCQLSKTKNREEIHQEPLDADGSLPVHTSPINEGKFFLWPHLYFYHTNYLLSTSSPDQEGSKMSSLIVENKEFAQFNPIEENCMVEMQRPLPRSLRLTSKAIIQSIGKKKKPMLLFNQVAVRRLDNKEALLACWNDKGQTPLHVCVEMKIIDVLEVLVGKIGPDVKGRDGKTVLRAAVDADWLPGVREALRHGADVTIQALDGETPLHIAATVTSNEDKELRKTILFEIINVAEQRGAVNCLNAIGETALFNAVRSGDLSCVRLFLEKGALIQNTPENNLSVFHVAAEYGHNNILEALLSFDEDTTKLMINSLTVPSLEGYAPIHYAVGNNSLSCAKILKEKNADICKATNSSTHSTTPLHMAVDNENYEIAEYIILSSNDTTFASAPSTNNELQNQPIKQANGKGWLPLHSAIFKGNETIIKLLLKYDASLASQTQTERPKTALDMIIRHVTNPTEFLEGLLDSCISFDNSPNKIIIDYKILMPSKNLNEELDVIEALIKTGNEFNQKNLLLHPLIESFIYLKWWALMPFYFLTAGIYMSFWILLITYATIVFYHIDTSTKPDSSNLYFWGNVILFVIVLNSLQEYIMNVDVGYRYYRKPENIVKIISFMLASILPLSFLHNNGVEVARFVATWALLLSCVQMLNTISQCPYWGYYVVMFKKVACNVFKILGTFSFLLTGFAISFMIQFGSASPFDNPWHAFLKILVLLTAEFNYDDLFKSETDTNVTTSSKEKPAPTEGTRLIFIAFLILIAIVLMNVMTGVAVDDINKLKTHGSIGRLEKQVVFVRSLDTLKYIINTDIVKLDKNRSYNFPEKISLDKQTVERRIFSNIRKMPKRFKDAFFSKAQNNKDKTNDKKKLIESDKKENMYYQLYEQTMERLVELEKTKMENAIQTKDLYLKLEVLSIQSLEILQFLKSSKEDKKKLHCL